MRAAGLACFVPLFLLLLRGSCEQLGAEDYAVSIRYIVKNNKNELEFTCISNLPNVQAYRILVKLLRGETILEDAVDQKATNKRQWKYKLKSEYIRPRVTISYQLEILSDGDWYSSPEHHGEVPEQSGMVDGEELGEPTTTTTAEEPTTAAPKVYTITRKPSSKPTSTSTRDNSGEERDHQVRQRHPPPPPQEEKKEDLNLTVIIVSTIVPIVVMGGLVLIVFIIIKYRRRHVAVTPPPPYELTAPGTMTYGSRSTMSSQVSQGKGSLPPAHITRGGDPQLPAEPDPYTYVDETYEQISADKSDSRSLPDTSPASAPLARSGSESDENSIYIDPEIGLPNPDTPPPMSLMYECPLPRSQQEMDNRVYLAMPKDNAAYYPDQ